MVLVVAMDGAQPCEPPGDVCIVDTAGVHRPWALTQQCL